MTTLLTFLADAREAMAMADAHTKELRDAWQRGAINECDGKSEIRSNRNVDVEVACREILAQFPAAIAEAERLMKKVEPNK